jgi:hypothetical protein
MIYRKFANFFLRRATDNIEGRAAAEVFRVRHALDTLDGVSRANAPQLGAMEEPIFILATGWRCGSTLLQRIVMTDPAVLIWGEPLGRVAVLPKLTRGLAGISKAWPPSDFWFHLNPHRSNSNALWIANLFPDPIFFRNGLTGLFAQWWGAPARAAGYTRWGTKEVRLGLSEALLLKWLFPRAKFIALIRNPFDCYRSIKAAGLGWELYAEYPDQKVNDVQSFARNWMHLAASWLAVPEDFGHRLIRYEDLISSDMVAMGLGEWLGLSLTPSAALNHRVGGTSLGHPLCRFEINAIENIVRGVLHRFGYESARPM